MTTTLGLSRLSRQRYATPIGADTDPTGTPPAWAITAPGGTPATWVNGSWSGTWATGRTVDAVSPTVGLAGAALTAAGVGRASLWLRVTAGADVAVWHAADIDIT